MAHSINRKPLLQQSESDSEFPDDILEVTREFRPAESDNSVIVNSVKPLFRNEPADKYNMAYLIFYLLGMTTLFPWFFFITADEYWMYKFRDVENNTVHETTPLQAGFESYLSVASSVPNTLILILNIFLGDRFPLQLRMVGSLAVMLILFIATTAFVKINTDEWQLEFFTTTMVIVIVLNVASAVLNGGLFGIVGTFSSAYITAVVSGQALGGIFAAIAEILSLTFGASALLSALVYFIIADATLILALISYIILSKSVFFKFHTEDKFSLEEYQSMSTRVFEVSYVHIFKKIWVYGFSVFSAFAVTLAVYPGVTALIESQYKGNGNEWNEIYFVPVVGYLLFSCGDYFGRIFAGYFEWPKKSWQIAVLGIVRILFIPLILLCNAKPRQHIPILIPYDLWYILIMALFALTNGYLTNISLISAPKVVHQHEKETASSMMAAFLGVGLACGSALCILLVKLI